MNVYINVEEINAAIQEFYVVRNQLSSESSELGNLIGEVASTWSGNAGTLFVQELTRQRNEINNTISMLDGMISTSISRRDQAIALNKKQSVSINNVSNTIANNVKNALNDALDAIKKLF